MGKKTWLAASGMDDRGVYLADGAGSAGGRSASDCSGSDRAGRERSGDFTVKTAGIWSGDTGRKSRSRMER